MELIKTSEALALANGEGWVLFGGRNNYRTPADPIMAKPVLGARGRVEWYNSAGQVFNVNRTGTTVWAQAVPICNCPEGECRFADTDGSRFETHDYDGELDGFTAIWDRAKELNGGDGLLVSTAAVEAELTRLRIQYGHR